MERMAVRSHVTGPQDQEHSFRSMRSTTQYNINDYLPPSTCAFSRKSVYASRKKEKIYTEPNDRIPVIEVNQIKKNMELHQEEKQNLRREIERLNCKLEANEKQIKEKDQNIHALNQKVNHLETNMKILVQKLQEKPLLSFSRSNLHFIHFPKLSQKYEVSVQTDAVEYHLPSINMTKSTATIKLDREMSQIQQKLSKLNQFKKLAKEKPLKMQEYPSKYEKAEAIFSKINDKQNKMRISNTFERLTSLPQQRIREQTIQILPVQLDQMERLIQQYME